MGRDMTLRDLGRALKSPLRRGWQREGGVVLQGDHRDKVLAYLTEQATRRRPGMNMASPAVDPAVDQPGRLIWRETALQDPPLHLPLWRR